MMCYASCYLKKTIKEAEQQENSSPNPLQEKQIEIVYIFDTKQETYSLTQESKVKEDFMFVSDCYSFYYLKDIFHPPPSKLS